MKLRLRAVAWIAASCLLFVLCSCDDERADVVTSKDPICPPEKGELDERLVGGNVWLVVACPVPFAPDWRLPFSFRIVKDTQGSFRLEPGSAEVETRRSDLGDPRLEGFSAKVNGQYYWNMRSSNAKPDPADYALYSCTFLPSGLVKLSSLNQTVIGQLIASKRLAGAIERSREGWSHDKTDVTTTPDEIAALLRNAPKDLFWNHHLYKRYSPDDVKMLLAALKEDRDEILATTLARLCEQPGDDLYRTLFQCKPEDAAGFARKWVKELLELFCACVPEAAAMIADHLADDEVFDKLWDAVKQDASKPVVAERAAKTGLSLLKDAKPRSRLRGAEILTEIGRNTEDVMKVLLEGVIKADDDGAQGEVVRLLFLQGVRARARKAEPVVERVAEVGLKLLKDDKQRSRLRGAELLIWVEKGVGDAVARILDDLPEMSEKKDDNCFHGFRGLWYSDKERGTALIEDAVMSPNADVSSQAVKTICDAGPRAGPFVSGLVNQLGAKYGKQHVAMVLGRLGPLAKSAVPSLTKVAQFDPDSSVRQAASEALKSITSQEALGK